MQTKECVRLFFFDKKTLYEIAEECVSELKETDVEMIRLHFMYDHFGYGLYLRNRYFQRFRNKNLILRENLGAEIYACILTKLFKGLAGKPEEALILCHSEKFAEVCSHYYKQKGTMPFDDFTLEWKTGEDIDYYCRAVDTYATNIAESIWNYRAFAEAAESAGISKEKCLAFYEYCRKIFSEENIFIPLEALYLKERKTCNVQIKYRIKLHLTDFFQSHCNQAGLLPAELFDNRNFVKFAAQLNGSVLKYTKRFISDREIVCCAVESNPAAIEFASEELQNDTDIIKIAAANSKSFLLFELPCMKKYNDNEEIVKLAILANGANICCASERLRDDYDMAECALKNQKDIYPASAYKSLSKRLRENKTLALIEAESDFPDIESMPEQFKDDEQIAAAIHSNENEKYQLCYMSERIRKIYNV